MLCWRQNMCKIFVKAAVKCNVHDCPSYDLSGEKMTALSYGVDTHIPINTNTSTIAT